MRTSLIEIERIDQWLLNQDAPASHLLMDARLVLDPVLRSNVRDQKTSHDLIRRYGRQKLINEIRSVEHELFSSDEHRSFRDKVKSIFNL